MSADRDDIFLMQKIQKKYPASIGFVKDYKATVFTHAEKSIGRFISQRVRWASKSKSHGTFFTKLVMLFVYVFHLFLIGAGFVLLRPDKWNWLPLAVMGGSKVFVDLLFCIPLTHFFRKKVLLLLLPFIEMFHVLYITFIGLAGLTGRYRWKDRLIK
ncbi:MAG: hypothetical protein IPP77_04675 [Bacteroidetes bacterium]|nr:hypothetical protein [Bacteroidota bacterium]